MPATGLTQDMLRQGVSLDIDEIFYVPGNQPDCLETSVSLSVLYQDSKLTRAEVP